MANQSSGTKNQPLFTEAGAPELGADYNLVSNYAAKVGNRRVGTTTERNAATGADLWTGLQWFDTTLMREFFYTGSGWQEETIPAPQTAGTGAVQTITATSWTNLPTAVTVTLVLTAAAWVRLDAAAWMVATTSDLRVGIDVSGATTSDPNVPQWGASMYVTAGQLTVSNSCSKTIQMNAGTNTINLQAYRTAASGTQVCSYAVLFVTPLRYA